MPKAFFKIFVFLFFCLSIFSIIFVYSRGILLYDEGWILHPAQRILQGDVIYKDFHYIYTPGSVYITAISFWLFGQSILATRIMLFVFTTLSILIILYLCRSLKFGLTSSLISIGMFVAWLPLHINFSWPVVYASFSMLLTMLILVLYNKNSNYKYLIFTGIACALTFFFKQNFGIAVIISTITFILLTNTTKLKSILFYLLGICIFIIPWLIYMINTNSLISFINDTYFLLFLGNGIQATPFIYPAPIIIEILKTLFYLLPLIFSAVAIYLVWNKDRKLVLVPIFTGTFYLLGIRPTTDFTHFIPLIAVSGITIAILFEQLSNKLLKFCLFIFIVLLVFVGIYTAFFRGYYTWNPTILNYNQTLSNNRIGIFVDSKSEQDITNLVNFVNSHTSKGDSIFVTRFSPLLYFILDRNNPTKYEFFNPYTSINEANREIENNLIKNNVKIIITDYSIENDNNLLPVYIKTNYTEDNVQGFNVWIKK
jgi:4-amino-4-deoxy-L-arabinose transferase-like glycosyltransferase